MSQLEKINIEVKVPSEKLCVEHAHCPNGHSLMDETVKIHGKSSIKVKVKYDGHEGVLYVDPVYGSYENIAKNITLPNGAVIDIFCPECDISLKEEGEFCNICSSPMFEVDIPNGGIIEGCLKVGCVFHKMKIVDGAQRIGRLFENDTMASYL